MLWEGRNELRGFKEIEVSSRFWKNGKKEIKFLKQKRRIKIQMLKWGWHFYSVRI